MAELDLVSSKPSAWGGKFKYSYEQSIANNTTTITISVFAKKNDGCGSGTNSGQWIAYISVNEQSKSLATSGGYTLRPAGTWIGDGDNKSVSFTVKHKEDGSLSCNVSITVSPPSGLSWSGETLSYDGAISVDKIPRASGLSAANDVYIGAKCSVTWVPKATNFYYRLKFNLGTWSNWSNAIYPNTVSSYLYSDFTIPYEVASQIPNSDSGIMSVTLFTYSDAGCTNLVGSSSPLSFTVTVPDSLVPSIVSINVSLVSDNAHVKAWQDNDNNGWAGFSKARITCTGSGTYGSSIVGYTISGGTYSATVSGSSLDYLGAIISSSGQKEFRVTCRDSRGKTSAISSGRLSFLPYTPPKVRRIKMSKDAYGRMVVNAIWDFDAVGGRNASQAVVYYKTTNVDEWIQHTGALSNGVDFVLTDFVPDIDASYNFRVVAGDYTGSISSRDAFSSTETVLMDFRAGGSGLGIGKKCESDRLEVSMDTIFFNDIFIGNNSIPLDTYIQSLMTVLPDVMFGDTDPIIPGARRGQLYFKKLT